jgi:hypothetical protein
LRAVAAGRTIALRTIGALTPGGTITLIAVGLRAIGALTVIMRTVGARTLRLPIGLRRRCRGDVRRTRVSFRGFGSGRFSSGRLSLRRFRRLRACLSRSRLRLRAFTRGGGAGLSVATLLLGERGLNGALAGFLLLAAQSAGAAAAVVARRLRGLSRALSLRTSEVQIDAGSHMRRRACGRRADAALGFHHHGLGAAVAEALLDRAAGDIACGARLQRQRRALRARTVAALWGMGFIVFSVAHPAL